MFSWLYAPWVMWFWGISRRVVKCKMLFQWGLWGGHRIWLDIGRGSCQPFPLQCVKWSYTDFLPVGWESWHEKEFSRNGWHDWRVSLSWAVTVVHVTWHPGLWGVPRTYSSILYTQSARSLQDISLLESSFGTAVWKWVNLNVDAFGGTDFLLHILLLNSWVEMILIFITLRAEALTVPFGFT